ncbi:unnamed protein product [Microthlaspi erraticum]|uniref:Factor of DNA methylation 1-5/IDN2 domain-containing protein n=1 Tax=Microthlaspi erraticum TaxID=1685480 RepID=A0A6D2I1H8_9BRAS|nr:unnamed protein product [Microthlaspi erraticum]
MDDVRELQKKISDYERKMLHYKTKIFRLENDIFDKDQEIIGAKFTLLQALPEINTPENNTLADIERIPGRIDPMIYYKACNPGEEEPLTNERGMLESGKLSSEWALKITRTKRPNFSELKDKYGEELYNAVKIAWIEAQESRRTGVKLKPWNYEAGREQTLAELLVLVQAQIQILKNHH